ncbi:MAG: serine hydrolase [Alphaproteobacteria bacterium]|nr:serine hydrolase [Alphaproteobacteria bacterium]
MLTLLASLATAADRPPIALEPGVPWAVPERERWTGPWPTATPEESGIDPAALEALAAYTFRRTGDEVDRKGSRTNALVIVRHGKLVYEGYGRETTAKTPLLAWSVTKSFGNTVYGAAVHEGLISLDDPVCKHYAPMCGPGHDQVRVTDMMRMSSGLHWVETYEASPIFSSVTAMLYSRGSADMAAFTAAQPMSHPPGAFWLYSSGDSNVLSAALKGPLGARYDDYPWTALFEPLGMESAVYEQDAAGTFVASSYLYASAPDLARWAQMVLDDGTWQGQRLLAEGWVRYSTTIAPAFYTTALSYEHVSSNPGAQWYVNLGDPNRSLDPPWPSLPPDAFGASGHWGKFVWIVPSWDLVVVRMGDDREYGCSYPGQPECVEDPEAAFTKHRFLELLAEAVKPHAPPPVAPPEPAEAPAEGAP